MRAKMLRLFSAVLLLALLLAPLTPALAQEAAPPTAAPAPSDGAGCVPLSQNDAARLSSLSRRQLAGELTAREQGQWQALSQQAECMAAGVEPQSVRAAASYTFSQSDDTHSEISGGIVHGTGSGLSGLNFNAVNIGFTFVFDGVDYTQVSIHSNGFLRMGGATYTDSCGYKPISSSSGGCVNLLAALGGDLQGNTDAELRSETSGEAPNRVFTVQWKDFRWYGAVGDSFNFQIKLYETSNAVEFVYGSFSKNATARGVQVGVKGASTADFANRTGSDWAASSAGGVNTATMALNNTGALPASGLIYRWTPPNFPPTIVYQALANTLSSANRSFDNVAITDVDGINTEAGAKPRVYFKRAADSNAWNDNTAGSEGWKYVEATGASSPFDFTLDYSLLYGGAGVSVGTVVQYFVVAQDLSDPPKVGIKNGEFAAMPASVALTAAAFPLGGTINSYRISLPYSGSYSVPGDYGSLSNAGGIFEALNNGVLTGNVVINITADLSGETGAVALNQFTESPAGSNYTLTIKPSGAARAITGSGSSATLIKLNGADRVTIDGSLSGGSDRSLTLSNPAASDQSTVIWLASTSASDGATNNVIKNCNVAGASPATSLAAIISSGSTVGGVAQTANANNTFQNNAITAARYGIMLVGPAGNDSGNLITGNVIGSTAPASQIGLNGIAVFQQANATVSNNRIAGVVTATSATASGINVGGTANGIAILANQISNIKNNNTEGWGSNGIFLGASMAAANVTVANNFIFDVASYGNSEGTDQYYNGYGIMVNSGGGYQIYYNSVLLATNQSNGGIPAALNIASDITGAGAINLRNNIFASKQTTGAPYAIYCSADSSVFAAIDFNLYYASAGTLGYLDAAHSTLAAWQAATGQDAHSVAGDPLFVANTNLHISTPASPASDAATPIDGITSDIDNQTRSATTPDIGADEFTLATVTMSTTTGWNLIALPVQPAVAHKAQSLLDLINGQGGQCSEINRWYFGGWNAHLNSKPTSNNFSIEMGKGYFVKCSANATWTLQGYLLTSSVPINLVPGWNLIAVPYPAPYYNAQMALNAIAAQGGQCSEVDRWYFGGWNVHQNSKPTSNNFSIDANKGYFLKCSMSSTFTP